MIPTQRTQEPVVVDELLESVSTPGVQGMDDRVSMSSEEEGDRAPVPQKVMAEEDAVLPEQAVKVHGMDDRISLSSEEGDRRPIPTEELIKPEENAKVHGMDDRISVSSSEDSMVVREVEKGIIIVIVVVVVLPLGGTNGCVSVTSMLLPMHVSYTKH